MSIAPCHVGRRCVVRWLDEHGNVVEEEGDIAYVGPHKVKNEPRVGVILDNPRGRNNGTIGEHKYFVCNDDHGLLCVPEAVTLSEVKSAAKQGPVRNRSGTFSRLFRSADRNSGKKRNHSFNKRYSRLIDDLSRVSTIKGWGSVVTAAKGIWLGSGILNKVNPDQETMHIMQSADDIRGTCTAGQKAIFVVTKTHVGAVNPKKQHQILLQESVNEIYKVLELEDLSVIAYVTRNSLLKFRHVHVFALKRPNERMDLVIKLRSLSPQLPKEDDPYESAQVGVSVLPSRYLGTAAVGSKAWWRQNLPHAGNIEGKDLDELFYSATSVCCNNLRTHARDRLDEDSGVVVKPEHIILIDSLTQQELNKILCIQVVEVRVLDVPHTAKRAQSMDSTMKHPPHRNGADQATNDIDITEEALVAICYKDEQVNSLNIDVLMCTRGIDAAETLAECIRKASSKALQRQDDPFNPTTQPVLPKSKKLRPYELDRNNLMAIDLVGHGEFGEVYLANHSVAVLTSEAATEPKYAEFEKGEFYQIGISPNHPDANDAGAEEGHVEIQRAVKTVKGNVGKKAMKELTMEAEIQSDLKHEHIVEFVGVCFSQLPLLVVFEYIMYGDLKKVLRTLSDKEILLRSPEQIYFCEQVASAMMYITSQKIVHLDLATRNLLLHAKSHIKLADFGLARRYTKGKNSYHLEGKMKIPFLWCPPECLPRSMWNKEVTSYHPRFNQTTDIWAFGVVIWEILTYGLQPYGKELKLVKILQHIDEKGLRLTWPDGGSEVLTDIGTSCFADKPSERPEFSELYTTLGKHLESSRKRLRDVGKLLNAPLEDRLREMSTQATIMRRKSMHLLRSSSLDETITEPIQEDDESAFSTPVKQGRPHTICLDDGFDVHESPFGRMSTRKSLFNRSNWSVDKSGRSIRRVMHDANKDDADMVVRTASTHSNSDEESGEQTQARTHSSGPIRRMYSKDMYSDSESDGETTTPVNHDQESTPMQNRESMNTPTFTSPPNMDLNESSVDTPQPQTQKESPKSSELQTSQSQQESVQLAGEIENAVDDKDLENLLSNMDIDLDKLLESSTDTDTKMIRPLGPRSEWSVNDVALYLSAKNLSHVAPIFQAHNIDGKALDATNAAEMTNMGIDEDSISIIMKDLNRVRRRHSVEKRRAIRQQRLLETES
eukprot:m.31988 g.31988  ORF g.31988 m.31988 type:complete len:1170 (-) comp8369_c0_seq1:1055-4564(-)